MLVIKAPCAAYYTNSQVQWYIKYVQSYGDIVQFCRPPAGRLPHYLEACGTRIIILPYRFPPFFFTRAIGFVVFKRKKKKQATCHESPVSLFFLFFSFHKAPQAQGVL